MLTTGWYLAPVLGWIGGLVMIGVGSRWTTRAKRRAILTSVIGGLVAVAGILMFRGTDAWMLGLGILLIVPLIVNIFVGSFLRAQWGGKPAS